MNHPRRKMNGDIVIYTASFGPSVTLMPQKKFDNIRFICFSDRKQNAGGWETEIVEPPFGSDNTRNNRYFKLQPHLFFPADTYSIYIDANIIVLKSPESLIQQEMQDVNMLVFDHNQTIGDARNTVQQEYEALCKYRDKNGKPKDDPAVMTKQMELFKANGFPDNNGLIKGCVLIRKHNAKDVIAVMQDWWWFVENMSRRDQLSFNYVAWKHGFRFGYLQGDVRRNNNWFYMAGKGDKHLFYTLLKFKIRQWLRRLWRGDR